MDIIHYFDYYLFNNSDNNTISSSLPTFKKQKYQRRRSLGCQQSSLKKQKYHRRRSLGSCHNSNSFLSTIDEHNENENTNIDENNESNEFEYEYDYLDYDVDYNDNNKCNNKNNNNNNVSIIEGVMNIIMIYSIIIIILGGTAIIAFEKRYRIHDGRYSLNYSFIHSISLNHPEDACMLNIIRRSNMRK